MDTVLTNDRISQLEGDISADEALLDKQRDEYTTRGKRLFVIEHTPKDKLAEMSEDEQVALAAEYTAEESAQSELRITRDATVGRLNRNREALIDARRAAEREAKLAAAQAAQEAEPPAPPRPRTSNVLTAPATAALSVDEGRSVEALLAKRELFERDPMNFWAQEVYPAFRKNLINSGSAHAVLPGSGDLMFGPAKQLEGNGLARYRLPEFASMPQNEFSPLSHPAYAEFAPSDTGDTQGAIPFLGWVREPMPLPRTLSVFRQRMAPAWQFQRKGYSWSPNNAAGVAEGAAFPETELNAVRITENCTTIGHRAEVTRQALLTDDGWMQELEFVLSGLVVRRASQQLATGDGTGNALNGLAQAARVSQADIGGAINNATVDGSGTGGTGELAMLDHIHNRVYHIVFTAEAMMENMVCLIQYNAYNDLIRARDDAGYIISRDTRLMRMPDGGDLRFVTTAELPAYTATSLFAYVMDVSRLYFARFQDMEIAVTGSDGENFRAGTGTMRAGIDGQAWIERTDGVESLTRSA